MRLKWPGINESGTVLIELAAESFCLAKDEIKFLGETFTPKDELHVTLVGSELSLIFQNKIKQNKAINKLLKKIFEDIDWSFKQSGPVHILSRKKGKVVQKSIIMRLDMHGVTSFYDQLKAHKLVDLETPVPPPHVTMYTQNCPLGIGVPNDDALNTLSGKILPVNSLNNLCE